MNKIEEVKKKMDESIEKLNISMKNMVGDVMSGNCYLIIIYLVCIIFLIIFSYSIYLKKEFSKGVDNLKKMKEYDLKSIPGIKDFADYEKDGDEPNTHYALIDYHVKSSFNSCCSGPVINGSVSLEALGYVIKEGVRFLDFEIYLVKNEAVVAAGRGKSVHLKDTLNHINISTVLEFVKEKAIDSSDINNNDPLILNFRIMSNNNDVYEILANSIKKVFNNKLMSANYGFCGEVKSGSNKFSQNGKDTFTNNIFFQDFLKLKGKVIILAKGPPDDPTSYKENKNFYELTNGGARDGRTWYKTNYDVTDKSKSSNIDGNKMHYCITYPDVVAQTNSNAKLHLEYGCQAIMMNFGAGFNKSQMELYKKTFADKMTAFILKEPRSSRRIRKFTGTPTPQDQNLDTIQKKCIKKIGLRQHDFGYITGGC
jgi:hypothetical protein